MKRLGEKLKGVKVNKMNYIKLKGEIVLLDNILHAEMKENTIEILYGIVVPEQGNKFYGHILDYSEVKNVSIKFISLFRNNNSI